MDDNGFSFWSQSIRKKRTYGLHELLKKVVLEWWTLEPLMSHGQNDVTHKQLEPMVYDEKPTHFLMESQVIEAHILKLFCF